MGFTFPESLKGQFLISMPGMNDPNFSNTVTCICEHTTDGAVGIIINRQHDYISGRDIFEDLNISYVPAMESMPIHLGGPVHIDEIFILHGPPFGWEGCLEITSSVAMSNTMDIIESIAMGRGPKSAMLSLGCAGWGPSQLESEIKGNVWLNGPLSEDILFSMPIESRWNEAVRRIGIEPSLLSETAGHA